MSPTPRHCAQRDTDVIPVTLEGCQFFERVGYHDYEGIVLDGSEAPRIEDALGENKSYLGSKKSRPTNRR